MSDPKLVIVEILNELSTLFPQREVAEETLVGYADRLVDVPPEMLRAACERLSRRVDWFPTIAQIRAEVVQLVFRPPIPQEAWGIVLKEIRRVGHDGTPAFALPVIDQAVKALGWREICLSEEIDRIAARFDRTYEALVRRALDDAQVNLQLVMPALQDGERPRLRAVS